MGIQCRADYEKVSCRLWKNWFWSYFCFTLFSYSGRARWSLGVWTSPILAMASESNHLRSDGQFIFDAKCRNLACFCFHLIWRAGLSYLCFVNGLCIYVPRSHKSVLPVVTCRSLTVIILYAYPASKTSIYFDDDDRRQATNDVARLTAIEWTPCVSRFKLYDFVPSLVAWTGLAFLTSALWDRVLNPCLRLNCHADRGLIRPGNFTCLNQEHLWARMSLTSWMVRCAWFWLPHFDPTIAWLHTTQRVLHLNLGWKEGVLDEDVGYWYCPCIEGRWCLRAFPIFLGGWKRSQHKVSVSRARHLEIAGSR